MKNKLLTIQGKEIAAIPNPVSKEDCLQALAFIENLLADVPKELEKIVQPDITVLSIGLNPLYFIDLEGHCI